MASLPQTPLRLFLVAGEHSGDALGAKLMAALKAKLGDHVVFAGVGGGDMTEEGLASLFPIEDVAVMGPVHILPALPRLVSRVYQTVGAAIAFKPDAVIIIDSPEFTHPIAKRIRKRAPQIPIIDYVSPSVWAWRPGRAKKMKPYVDHILALLPFEPAAHKRLGGPACTYVGHPLIERFDDISKADVAGLRDRLGLDATRPVLLVLPGSRRSEVERLIDVFGETIARLVDGGHAFDVVIPPVAHVRALIETRSATWRIKPKFVEAADKYAAMRLARAALAASGTVTLELGLAQTPSVIAYKVDDVTAAIVRRLIATDTAVLANLVLGERVYPEFIQQDCTAEKMSAALAGLLDDGPVRARQIEQLSQIPDKMHLAEGSPSAAAAAVVLDVINRQHFNGP